MSFNLPTHSRCSLDNFPSMGNLSFRGVKMPRPLFTKAINFCSASTAFWVVSWSPLLINFPLVARYNSDMTIVEGNAPFYKKNLSKQSVADLTDLDSSLVLPHFTQFFANDMISAFAKHGEARNMNVKTYEVWDMAD